MIYKITHDNLAKRTILHCIYNNMDHNYYYSEDFSPEFYIALARAGFITVSHIEDGVEYLLPEIQFEYAVLEWENLHIPKKVKKLFRQSSQYEFVINEGFEEIIQGIQSAYDECWIDGKYLDVLRQLQEKKYQSEAFCLCFFGLRCLESSKIVAAEVGYMTSGVYTSLSGFCQREKRYNNYGKLQLVLLAQYLQKIGCRFWNLGHPYMEYKFALGATTLCRKEFLQKFLPVDA